MKHQTSSLQLCGQPTVLTLTQSTTRFGSSCRSVCTTARFVTSTSWSLAWSKSGNISTKWSSIKRSGSGIHVFELAFDFEHTVDILNTDFRCAEVLPTLFARGMVTVFFRGHSVVQVLYYDGTCWCLTCSTCICGILPESPLNQKYTLRSQDLFRTRLGEFIQLRRHPSQLEMGRLHTLSVFSALCLFSCFIGLPRFFNNGQLPLSLTHKNFCQIFHGHSCISINERQNNENLYHDPLPDSYLLYCV